jgi:DNA-binding YbaB/EbfC family protein
MLDMSKMFGKMKEVQSKLKEAQEGLVNITATGESGGGMVKATANGKKRVVSIEVEESLVNPQDKQMLQDLVIAAVNKALEEVEIKANEELKKTTEGMMPNIPGLDLSKMF